MEKTKKFSIDTNIGPKRKKNDERKLCQILHCDNDTAIVKWTESISSKQMTRGGGTAWVVLFRALFCGSQKKTVAFITGKKNPATQKNFIRFSIENKA